MKRQLFIALRFLIGAGLALLAYREWGPVAGILTFVFGGYISDTHYRVLELHNVRDRRQ